MIGTLQWSDCVHLSKVAWELAAFVLALLVHTTPQPVSPDQGLCLLTSRVDLILSAVNKDMIMNAVNKSKYFED